MANELLMAVDLGTSFIKAAVYDLDSNCLAIASEPVKDERPAPGVFIQHGEQLVESVLNCMRKVHDQVGDEKANRVAAIAFTGQMAGFMAVDENWNDITGFSCSLDTRYTPYVKKQMERLKEDFLNISGTSAPLFSTKYEWFKTEFPSEAKKIRKYLMLSSYICGKLGDTPIDEAIIDGSLTAWTGLADIKNWGWSEVICDKLGIPREYLPRICKSNEVVGKLSKKSAEVTGFKCGIPLVAGAGDKAAGCVGANILSKGDMIFEGGSYGAVNCLVDHFRPDYEERYYDVLDGCFAGDYYAHHYIPGSGITLDWYMTQFAEEMSREEMDAQVAAIAPGCDGLMAIGLPGGTAMPFDSDLKGIWMGYSFSHTKAHFYRALMECYTHIAATVIERINTNYPDAKQDSVRIIGGGAKSKVWSQMLADATGKKFERLDRDDVALWGASILAANGIGLVDDVKKLSADHIRVKAVFEPNPDLRPRYEELRAQYKDYAVRLSPFCRDLK